MVGEAPCRSLRNAVGTHPTQRCDPRRCDTSLTEPGCTLGIFWHSGSRYWYSGTDRWLGSTEMRRGVHRRRGRRRHMHGRRTAACAFLLCMLAAGQSATAQVQQLGSGEADVVEEFAILEEVARGAARFLELLGPFGCTPTVLRSVVQANVGHGIEVYGSAIAFEAGSYLFDVHNLSSGVRDPTGQVVVEPRNAAAGELYCPYAYRGPHWRDGEGEIFTMDLAYAYDYTTPDTDWFLEPRKSFASGAPVTDGFWSPPYEDIGAGNISMKTYSVPVRTTANLTALGVKGAISRPTPAVESPWLAEDAFSGKLREVDEHGMIEAWFWGVVTIDVPLENVQKWQPWHYPDSMFWAVVGAGAVLWAVACVVLVIVWKYRKQPVINATSPVLNAISLVGVLLITPAAMTFVLEPTPDNVVCRLRVVFSTLAMITIAAPLVAKTWRIARLFGRDPLKRKAIPDSRVVFRAMVLIGVQVVLSTMWVATPGAPEFVARRQTVQTTPPQYLSVAHCTDQESLQWTTLFYYAVILCYAGYVAFKARNAPERYNESTHILWCIVFAVFYGVLLVPLQLMVSNDVAAALLLRGVGLLFGAFVVLGFIFVPKLLQLRDNLAGRSTSTATTTLRVGGIARGRHSTYVARSSTSPNNGAIRRTPKRRSGQKPPGPVRAGSVEMATSHTVTNPLEVTSPTLSPTSPQHGRGRRPSDDQ